MTPRAHPLGNESHPDWDGVWDRYIALSEGQDAERAPTEPFPARAIIWGAAICLAFAGLLIGAVFS